MNDSFLSLASISSVVRGQMLVPSSMAAVGSTHGASLGRPDICIIYVESHAITHFLSQ